MHSTKKGFTLIELLIVVVIIGILAAIAIPKFANTKEKAYIASMKSDLRNLITAQEAYFSDNNSTYATSTTALGTSYKASSGVTVTIGTVSNTGWDATSAHNSTTKTCSIAVGGTSTNEGVPVCQ
ncbi:MAG TPA: prepilin-type N-terminal cleavage/methylation domain-containing protein [Gemmatimonadaceae bacterium]|nr:prepilin-type N-terminal cleavage/methylation domain-containing protein [Gemmatimonadaceae bacterium]